ncbi:MAG TPA: hypothetical protein DCY20_07985 [Firmicutes bacterium]|nr:hypothetical protein [Bacillota bacterium]
MNVTLSKRLSLCLEAVKPYKTLADIGTDHGYLPCAGILTHVLDNAIAADIGVGPLEAAKQQIRRYDLAEKIETRLGGGLSILKPNEVEAVVIAGMGGKLILSILDDNVALTKSFKRLVLQPNIDANLLRGWLASNSFEISDEKILLEDGKYYEIIVANPTDKTLNYQTLDLEFGPILKEQFSDVFQSKWQKEYHKNNEIINQLPAGHERITTLKNRQALLEEVLKCR